MSGPRGRSCPASVRIPACTRTVPGPSPAPSRGFSRLRPVIAGFLLPALVSVALAAPEDWGREWPETDFARHTIDLSEILSGGPPKDGIPSIDAPRFVEVAEVRDLGPREPVIGFEQEGVARAYPLRVLTWHEIVNDEVAGLPVAVTYCPLCNAAIVFDRRLGERTLEFGTTGKLRRSDLVMYDRETESWWQQFSGEAIVGELAGSTLTILPSRLESWERFRERHPGGEVLVPEQPDLRPYGANPYVGYDTRHFPMLYDGSVPEGIAPLARVVAVGERAWSLETLRTFGSITADDLVLAWEPGQASALDTRIIVEGRDVGNVTVQDRERGVDVPYHVTFAFVFHAFHPDREIIRNP